MKKLYVWLFVLFAIGQVMSQTTYYSKSVATNFNDVASWGDVADGSGTAPASISSSDNFIIANGAVLNLSGNATVRNLTINSGTLAVASNILTVEIPSQKNASFTVNTGGAFVISGGNLNVNGNVYFADASSFTQSGGTITVDGNDAGNVATSVASTDDIFAIGRNTSNSFSGILSLTGGTIIIVDPHTHTTAIGTSNGGNSFYYYSSNQVAASPNHTLQFGDGISSDAGGNAAYGFSYNIWAGSGRFYAGNLIINTGSGVNRLVRPFWTGGVQEDLTITSGEFRMQTTFYVAGDVINNGLLSNASTLYLGTFVNALAGSSTVPQSIGGSGEFRNVITGSATANMASLTINNTNASGVTLAGYSSIAAQPTNSFSFSGTLNLINGRVSMASSAVCVVGIATPAAGTLNITNGGFVNGTTLARWWTNAGTGTATTAGTDPSTQAGRYPFLNTTNEYRNAFLLRTTPTAGGLIAVTYNESAGTSTVSITDGAYTVDTRSNDSWTVSALSGTPAAAAHVFSIVAPNAFGLPIASPSNVRVVQAASVVGTQQLGTTTPGGQRAGLSFADLTSGAFHLGINSSELLSATPDYVSLQWPPTINIVQGGSGIVYGQVYEAGLTDVVPNIDGQAPGIEMWVGISPVGQNTNPNTWSTWVPATWNSGYVGNNDEYQATIGATLLPGTYYYATRFRLNGGPFVYGGIDTSNNGNFWNGTVYLSGVLTVSLPTPPVNDDCAGALSIVVNPDLVCTSITAGTLIGATASTVDAVACSGTEDDDVWFSFVATATTHRVSLLDITGSTTDLYHSLWTGADCNSLTLVAGSCSDPNVSNPSGLVIGQTYYIRVYSWTATPGQTSVFNVCVGTLPPPPANDECAGAFSLTVNANYDCGIKTAGTIQSATASAVSATACAGTEDDDVWFSFVATANTHRVSLIDITGSTTDLYHSLWTGVDCNSLTLVPGTCSDPNISNPTGLVIGQTYYVRVYSWTATTGQSSVFNICIGTDPCIASVPAPTGDAAQAFCNAATVSNLVATGTAIKWYSVAVGGTALLPTDALIDGQVYYASQTIVCEGSARLAVTVTINATAAPTGDANQDFCNETLADLAVTGTGLIWYDAATLGNVLPSTTALVDGITYYASQTLNSCESLTRLAVTVNENCPIVGCLTAPSGQWPSGTAGYTPTTCDGLIVNVVTTGGWAGEYSRINVVLGQTYTFSSSVATDFITISDIDGTVAYAIGTGSATWVSTLTGQIRFYTHLDVACGAATVNRTRSIVCGVLSTDAPDYVSLQWPPTINVVQGGSGTVYGQVYEAGLTDITVGQAPGIQAWVGISPVGQNTNPNTWTTWVPATFNVEVGNNDEYQATIGAALPAGTYYYATRFRLNTGPFVYGGIDASNNGNFWNGTTHLSGVLTITPPPAPANDLCTSALPLTVGVNFAANVTSGTIFGATTTAGLLPSCQANAGFEVWYTVVVPASGNLTVETQQSATDSMTDSVVTVYTGTCGTLTQVGCDDDAGLGNMSLVNVTGLTPGATVYVAVWKWSTTAPTATTGGFQVSAYDPDLSSSVFDEANFNYYPNPVTDILHVSYSDMISTVEVFNMLGQQVVTKKLNSTNGQIDMSQLPSGTYVIKVSTEEASKVIKVIKR